MLIEGVSLIQSSACPESRLRFAVRFPEPGCHQIFHDAGYVWVGIGNSAQFKTTIRLRCEPKQRDGGEAERTASESSGIPPNAFLY
jgi:hypothetical protein